MALNVVLAQAGNSRQKNELWNFTLDTNHHHL